MSGDVSMDQVQFSCAECLYLLTNPVTLHCGHIFCNVCINGCSYHEDGKDIYRCSQCKDTSTPRPVPRKNRNLQKVVERFRKTVIPVGSPAQSDTGSGDVECDSCTGRKRKATKSCLMCRASFCEAHLKPHYQSQTFMRHQLVEACVDLQNKICIQHDKLIEIYCRTDQSFICYLCTMDKHRGHDTVSANVERTEKQNDLKEEQMKSQQKIQEKQEKVQELKQTVEMIKKRSQAAVDDNEKIFTEMISSMEKRRSEVMEMIRTREKDELSQVEQPLKQLEQEIADLKKRVSDMEQLSQTPDHIHFLQNCSPHCVSSDLYESPNFNVNQDFSFDELKKSLSDMKTRVEKICQEKFRHIQPQAAALQMSLPSEPKSRDDFLKSAAVQKILPSNPKIRDDFLQYFCYLTLDPNTAHHQLVLSENNTVVRRIMREERYRGHPDRFDSWSQVLCKEKVCGRCYWEVDWSGDVSISVSYKDINRKGDGDESLFGYNTQSWSLVCFLSSVCFTHNNINTKLRGPASSRIGVYVDHSAGTLSFYSVTDTMKLLKRVQTTFTQTLYAGFCMGSYESTARIF